METSGTATEVDDQVKYAWQIGGWLVLVAIGIIVRPFTYMYSVVKYITDIISEDYLKIMYEQARENSSFDLALFVLWETFVNIGLLGTSIFLVYAFFTRKKYFPVAFTIFLVSSFLIPILDVVLANAVFGLEQDFSKQDSGRTILGIVIWIPYMFVSERAKRTFVF